jgi:hypothetical protein
MLERNGHGCLRADAGEVCRGKNRKRQAGVHTEGNMPPACRGAGSQSPGSSAGGSRELRSTNRWPTWRTTVPYQVRLLATVPYRARFSWARCAWMCPASRRHCACVLRLKTAKTVPYRFTGARARAGGIVGAKSEKGLIPEKMATPRLA